MDKRTLVSFIIPSYNSAHTVRRCLDSIYALPLEREEFEVIFVDDCSTDNTIEVVEQYCQEMYGVSMSDVCNLTLLRQPKNNRQGAARNRGVSVAQGEYICFVDSDDAVTEGIVSAIRLAKEHNTDMTVFHYGHANEQGIVTREAEKLSFKENEVFTGVEMQNRHFYWCSGPVAYVYSRDFLNRSNYPFREGVLYEDSDFVAVHLYYAQRMMYSPELGYIAYYREGSTTHSTNFKNTADYFLLGSRMLAFYEKITNEGVNELTTESEQFAEGILEGAIHNVTMSLKRLYKLNTPAEIVRYYKRIDSHVNRRAISDDSRMHQYPNYWSKRALLGIRHKYLSILINSCLLIAYRIYVKHFYPIRTARIA